MSSTSIAGLRRPPGRPTGRPLGFTLIEMMVALLLTGIVALTARALFAQVMVGADAIARERTAGVSAEARLWVQESCRGVEVGVPGTSGFIGSGTKAVFTSRLPGPEGWTERRQALLSVIGSTIRLSAGPVVAILADSVHDVAFDYLVSAEGQGGWVVGWDSPVSAPIAIRIRWTRASVADSLLCVIGERG